MICIFTKGIFPKILKTSLHPGMKNVLKTVITITIILLKAYCLKKKVIVDKISAENQTPSKEKPIENFLFV